MAKVGFSVRHTSGLGSRFSKMKVASTRNLSLPTVYETAVTFTDGFLFEALDVGLNLLERASLLFCGCH